MADLLDYIDWRGDLSFKESKFNEVDAALFSQLALIDLDQAFEICPNGTISEIFDAYIKSGKNVKDQIGLVITNMSKIAFEKMANSNRYKNIVIHNYINDVIEEISLQFCAMQLEIDDKTMAVVFSGTDDTIAGWQENFEMIFDDPTGGQVLSTKYLKAALDDNDKKCYVIGHSKGGNLTLYSTLYIDKIYLPRIIKAYSFDGPGLVDRDMKTYNKSAVKKIIEYCPQSSMVGRIFNHPEEYIVCKSNAIGMWQHDLFSWEVLGNSFIKEDALTDESLYFDYKLKETIKTMSEENREKFVLAFFKFLYSTDSKTLTDLNKNKNRFISSYFKLSKDERKTLQEITKEFTKDRYMQSLAFNEVFKRNKFKLDEKLKKEVEEKIKLE